MLSSGEMVFNWIFSYLSPAAVFFAMVGNFLIFIVFSMKFYRGSISSLLYRTLASVQALNAYLDGIHVIPIEMEKDSLFTYNRVTCKVVLFMSYWLRALVVWILVNIAQERLIGVVFPHRARALNTRCRYGWQLFAYPFCSLWFTRPLWLLSSTHWFWQKQEARAEDVLWINTIANLGGMWKTSTYGWRWSCPVCYRLSS